MLPIKLYKNKDEAFLEPFFRELRFKIALKDLRNINSKDTVILDYGCGPEAKFYNFLCDKKIDFKMYCGFDPLLKEDIIQDKLLITSDWKIIESYTFHLITMFAVLEHVPYPNFNFEPLLKNLKIGGNLLLTTPTKIAKPTLEFLSYKLGIVSRREIEEHKHYFDLREIEKLFSELELKVVKKKTFEFGMNNYAFLTKY